MANYAILKSAIQDVIKQNGNNEITGEILQQSLLAMVNSLGAGYQFAGIAKLTPTQTEPGTPDQNVFYIATEPGTYTNFPISGGYLQVSDGEVAIFKFNGSWSKESTGIKQVSVSQNVLSIGGVESGLLAGQMVENPEFVKIVTDGNDRVLYGVKSDGDFFFGCGVPGQIEQRLSENTTQRNNILYRQRYNGVSSNFEEIIDISNRKFSNQIQIGIFSSDYLNLNKRYDVYGSVDGITFNSIATNRYTNTTYIITVRSDIKYIKIATTNISGTDNLAIGINVWSDFNNERVIVAANNSSSSFKREAHFICDGVNDEIELDEAAVLSNWSATIYLSNGYFYVDSFIHKTYKTQVSSGTEFSDYSVITNFMYNGVLSNKNIIGAGKSTNEWGKGTRIYVRESAFANVPDSAEPYVIGGALYGSTSRIIVRDIAIRIENNQHKVVCINGQYLGALIVDSCTLSAGANVWSETLPVDGCVGLRGIMGDCNGSDYVLSNTYAIAFRVGFQLGGEHLVAYELGTRFCYYGYTFGEYDYGSVYNSGNVTDSHPLTLINCCDEGSRALPKFVKSGMYADGNVAAKQQIDLIGWNMEVHTAELQGAIEVTSGAFCGTIDFVAYGETNTSKDTPGPRRRNRVDIKFWASDSDGKYFRTTNAAHAEMGTTAERLGYWAQKMQRYYDTDLNKMLVCTSEDNQEWRDFNGNIIS